MKTANHENETAFIRDCREFNAGLATVNPYVGNATCYGIPYDRVKPLLTKNGVFHPVYNPAPTRIDLEERQTSGLTGPTTYHADGKRIDRAEFDAIKRKAVRLESMSNSQVNGAWTFYTVAVMD